MGTNELTFNSNPINPCGPTGPGGPNESVASCVPACPRVPEAPDGRDGKDGRKLTVSPCKPACPVGPVGSCCLIISKVRPGSSTMPVWPIALRGPACPEDPAIPKKTFHIIKQFHNSK